MLRVTFCAVKPGELQRSNDNRLEVETPEQFTLLQESAQMQVVQQMLAQRGYTQVGGIGWRYLEPASLWGIAFTWNGEADAEVVGWYVEGNRLVVLDSMEQAMKLQSILRVGHPHVLHKLTCEWHT